MYSILLLDNYDSFTYNIAHYIESAGHRVTVKRNDDSALFSDEYDAVVLSPGPGLPEDAGDLLKVIRYYTGKVPILGICLGMQALAIELGGELYNQEVVKHGVQEDIELDDALLFAGLEKHQKVGLYHSWAIQQKGDFKVTSISENGVVMSIENLEKHLHGVQFHPESVMTPNGLKIIINFLDSLK